MSRNLLILALVVFGTGCSATRPHLSTIVVTPPGLSFRQLPRGDSWHWTPVTVTYPSESLTPAPCTPAPVFPIELVTCVEEDERLAPRWPSEPVPSVTTDVPAPPGIVHLEDATRPPSINLPIPSVAPVPLGVTPLVQTAVAVPYPSVSLIPPACSPSSVRPLQMGSYIEEDERPAPWSPSGPVPSVTTVDLVPPVHVSTPPVRVESTPPTESNWKPATSLAQASQAQTSTAIRCDQNETTLQVMQVESLSPPVPVPSDFSLLLTEIRNQRQLIEALQRDLTRERSADDAAIEELEVAVENLLVHTQTSRRDMPTTLGK